MFDSLVGKDRLLRLEEMIRQSQAKLDSSMKRGNQLLSHAKFNAVNIDGYFENLISISEEEVKTIVTSRDVVTWGSWQDQRWDGWECDDADLESYIRIAELWEHGIKGSEKYSVPLVIPFIGGGKTIVIQSSGKNNFSTGMALLRSLLVRTALLLPHQARYTLLDPAGNGLNFPVARHLPLVRESSADVRRDLDGVIRDVQRIIQTYLDAATTSFEQVAEEIRINERFEFVFAADFPNKYDRRSIEALQSLANTGPRAGTYLFIHHNKDHPMPRDMNMGDFTTAHYINVDEFGSSGWDSLRFAADREPAPDLQSYVFDVLRQAKPPERILDFDEVVGINKTEWFKGKSSQLISTPIGSRGGRNEQLVVWFGANDEGRPCAHGMLGAMTGSGKSNLYHVLILGLVTKYSPKELQLYLVDGKDGVEFQPYKSLPHAQVVSLRSSSELSRSVLAELLEEKERRNSIFSDTGVTDLQKYSEAGSPKGKIPRVLLLIDEYQELFEGDTDGVASNYLLQLAQQGRSVGIHMLLSSQRFGAAGMLNQTGIFGNIHLTMAMQMKRADIEALTEFGRQGRQLILMTCNLPGKIVVNDMSGDDGSNQAGKVAFLTSEQRMELINEVREKAKADLKGGLPIQTVVFDGKEQPNLLENPQVRMLLAQNQRLSPESFEKFARSPVHKGGIDAVNWFAAERPYALWLGQEFNVRGQARVIIRRRVSENVLIIGGSNPSRYGMLVAVLQSICVNSNPKDTKIVIVDRTIPGTPWSDTLHEVNNSLLEPTSYDVTFATENNDVTQIVKKMSAELTKRRGKKEKDLINLPSIFIVMTELDRVDELRRRPDAYGMSETELGNDLKALYTEGPSYGIHMVLSFSGARPMSHVLDPRDGLYNFRHRIALQMSEDESHTLIRSRKAAQLQLAGPTPINAIYVDMESDKSIRFKPYSIESQIPLTQQSTRISEIIKGWD